MPDTGISFIYLSQEDLLESGCFDISLAMAVAEKTLLSFEQHRVLFPEKIVQIFDQAAQDRINCLPATLLDDRVCGVKWVSVFPRNPTRHGVQNLSAIFVLSEIERGFPVAVMEGTLASNMRVAAMGGIAAKHLALRESEVIGFIGAGEQAKMHLLSMKVVRPSLKQCRVAARTAEEERQFLAYIDVAIGLALHQRAVASGKGTPLDLQQCMIFEHSDIFGQVNL